GLKYTSNSGIKWKTINEPAGFYAFETIKDSIFVVGGTEHVYVSNDTGRTWSITANYYVFSSFYESVSQILYLGTNHASNGICGIYTSSNYGFSWELLYVFPSVAYGQMITNLFVTRTNQVMLASVAYNYYPSGNINKLYRSIDNGSSWEIIFEDQYNYVSQIIEDANFTLFVLAGGKLLVSDDEGNTWVTKTIPQTKCLASGYNGKLYRAYSNQIYYSQDKGSTWIEANNIGLSGIDIYDMVINQNNRIYLATNKGVYYGEADSIVLSTEKIEPEKTFYLSQNFPNPFNPVTSIKYAVSSPANGTGRQFVTLKVYDILGNEIATLVNEEKQPGTYEVEFSIYSEEGRNLTSGIYFYQLKAGNYIETKKMVLIK
ncbi:MAG: T9SS type A sorting domain-containing protein, partial [Ignavibacteriaceae bacterium]